MNKNAIYSVGFISTNILIYGSLFLLTHLISAKEFAIVTLTMTLLLYTRTAIPLEISQAVSLYIVDHPKTCDKQKYFTCGLIFTVVMNMLFILVVALVSSLFHIQIPLIEYAVILTAIIILDAILYYCLIVLRWENKVKEYSLISVLYPTLQILLVYYFVVQLNMHIYGVFLSWFCSWLCGGIIAVYSVRKLFVLSFDIVQLKQMLKFSFPLFLNNIPTKLNMYVDRYVVLFFLGIPILGIYSSVAIFYSLATFIPAFVHSILWPTIYKSKNNEQMREELVRSIYFVFIIVGSIAAVGICFLKPVMSIVIGEKYLHNISVFSIGPIFILIGMASVIKDFFPGMIFAKKLRYQVYSSIVCLGCNVLLSLCLVSRYKMVGVAISALIALLSGLCVHIVYSQRLFRLYFKSSEVALLILSLLTMILSAVYINSTLDTFSLNSLLIRSICALAIFVACILLVKEKWQFSGYFLHAEDRAA